MRLNYIDNLKGILILLVTLGHFLIPIFLNDGPLDSTLLYKTIYLFHMPLFVFVSGFLSKRIYTTDKGLRVEKVLSIFLLGILFHALLCVVETKPPNVVDTILSMKISSAPWYLISLTYWYLLTPVFQKLAPIPAILLGLVVGVFAGCIPGFGHFMCLSRTLGFLPFFLLGFYCPVNTLERILKSRQLKVIGLVGLVTLVVFWLTKGAIFDRAFSQAYLSGPYKTGRLSGMCNRLYFYAVASLLSLSVMCVVPRKPTTCLSYLGKNTLPVYVIHRTLRPILAHLGLYKVGIFWKPYLGTVCIIAVSIAVTALCLIPLFSKPLEAIAGLNWHWLRATYDKGEPSNP